MRRSANRYMAHPPELSVLIPTLHYPHIDEVVVQLLRQTAAQDRYEIIISDSHTGEWRESVLRAAVLSDGARLVYVQRERGSCRRV